jgi:adenylylsulfate kinase
MQNNNIELNKTIKEKKLNQNAKVIWFTGLPCSGKTTLAKLFENNLFENNFTVIAIDGDIVRTGLNKDLGFSANSRYENIRRIAEVAKILIENGIIVIVSLVSPTIELRNMAKEIVGENDFIEVFINAPLDICEKRDIKGMYKKARQGVIKDFTGIDAIYEKPEKPFLEIKTGELSIEESINTLNIRIIPAIIKLKI